LAPMAQAQGMELLVEGGAQELWVQADRHRLEQVFLNLLTNARDAMANAARKVITITCTAKTDGVEMSFCDTGPGIPAGDEQRVFDPFSTTTEVGAGTGVGLAMTYGIIKEHQGTITVAHHPDWGAVFFIQFPLRRS